MDLSKLVGKAISIEGGEGSGKGTLIKSLREILGEKVVYTREPGGTPVGEDIRNVIMNHTMSSKTEAMLFASSRTELLDKVVFPALEETFVILDRYVHSSYVYQGIARGLGLEKVIAINNIATDGWMPNKTIILDLDPEIGQARINKDGKREVNRLDQENLEFHNLVREGYLAMKKLFPDKIEIIDASQSEEDILRDVLEIIEAL